MADAILSTLPAEPTKVSVSATNGNALLTFVRDEENFTEKQAKELIGVCITAYSKLDDTYIKILSKSVLWKDVADRAIPMYGIPSSCYLEFSPIVDKRIVELEDEEGTIYYDIVPEKYVQCDYKERALAQQHLETEYNVSVYCDTEALPGGGGGVSPADVQSMIDDTLNNSTLLAYDA